MFQEKGGELLANSFTLEFTCALFLQLHHPWTKWDIINRFTILEWINGTWFLWAFEVGFWIIKNVDFWMWFLFCTSSWLWPHCLEQHFSEWCLADMITRKFFLPLCILGVIVALSQESPHYSVEGQKREKSAAPICSSKENLVNNNECIQVGYELATAFFYRMWKTIFSTQWDFGNHAH